MIEMLMDLKFARKCASGWDSNPCTLDIEGNVLVFNSCPLTGPMELADTYSNGYSTHFSASQNSRKLSMTN